MKKRSSWRVILWAFLVLLTFLLVVILIFFVWLIRPVEDINTLRLIPKESSVYVTLRLNPGDKGIKTVLAMVKDRYIKNPVISWVTPYLLPYRVSGWMIYKPDTPKKPDYLIIADMGWRIRLIYLAKRLSVYLDQKKIPIEHSTYRGYWFITPRAKKSPLAGIAVIKGKVIASNRVELLKKAIDGLQGLNALLLEIPSISYLYDTMPKYDGLLLINNTDGWLTRIVREAEDKSNYSIFPSIDAVDAIGIGMDIIDGDRIEGKVVLLPYYLSRDRGEEMGEDIRFLKGMLRRALRAQDIDVQGNVTVERGKVHFTFVGKGFKTMWEKALRGEGL